MGLYERFSEFDKVDTSNIAGALAEAQTAPVYVPPPPPLPESGILAGTAQALGRGIVGIAEQGGQAMEWNPEYRASITPDSPAGDESLLSPMNKFGRTVKEKAEAIKERIGEPGAGDSYAKKAWFSGVESLPVSIAYGVPSLGGAIIGSTAGPGGTVAGAGIGQAVTAPVMYRAAAQEHADTLRKIDPNVDNQKLLDAAVKAGHAEWMGETISDIPEALIFSKLPGFKGVIKSVRQGLRPGAKTIAKNMAASQAAEQLGEGYTTYQQINALNDALPEDKRQSVKDAMQDTAGSTAVLGMLMGGYGSTTQYLRGRRIEKLLTNPDADPEKRGEAAGHVYSMLKSAEDEGTVTAGSADNFLRHAMNAIGDTETSGSKPYELDLKDDTLLQPVSETTSAAAENLQSQAIPTTSMPQAPDILQDSSTPPIDTSQPVAAIPEIAPAGPSGPMSRALAVGGIVSRSGGIADLVTQSRQSRGGIATLPGNTSIAPLPVKSEQERAFEWARQQIVAGNSIGLMQNRGVSDQQHAANVLDRYRKATTNGSTDILPKMQTSGPVQMDRLGLAVPEVRPEMAGIGSNNLESGGLSNGDLSTVQKEVDGETPQVPAVRSQTVTGLKKRRQLDSAVDTLPVAIAKMGGISRADLDTQSGNAKDLAHALNRMATKEAKAGILHVISAKGKPLDTMRESLVEQGYLPESSTVNDLLDRLDSASRGTAHYSSYADSRAAESVYDSELSRLQDMIAEMTDHEYEEFMHNQWLDEQAGLLAEVEELIDNYFTNNDSVEMNTADWKAVEKEFEEALNATEFEAGNIGGTDKTEVPEAAAGKTEGVHSVGKSNLQGQDQAEEGAGNRFKLAGEAAIITGRVNTTAKGEYNGSSQASELRGSNQVSGEESGESHERNRADAESIARAAQGAVRKTEGVASPEPGLTELKGRQKDHYSRVKELETEALLEHMQETGEFPSAGFVAAWERSGKQGETEHKIAVTPDGTVIRKFGTAAINHTWSDYLRRIGLHNSIFKETRYIYQGLSTIDGVLHVVVDQARIYGDHIVDANPDDVNAEMFRLGFEPFVRPQFAGKPTEVTPMARLWVRKKDGIAVWDIRSKNVLQDKNTKTLYFIDPVIEQLPEGYAVDGLTPLEIHDSGRVQGRSFELANNEVVPLQTDEIEVKPLDRSAGDNNAPAQAPASKTNPQDSTSNNPDDIRVTYTLIRRKPDGKGWEKARISGTATEALKVLDERLDMLRRLLACVGG